MSTYAYQGYGRGLELDEVRRLDRFATDGLVPDLYLVLDLSVETGRDRQKASDKKNDRLELSGDEFLEAVRAGYHELVDSDARAYFVDANGTIDEVHDRVKNLLRREMPATFALLED
jgi:dTMP kinase